MSVQVAGEVIAEDGKWDVVNASLRDINTILVSSLAAPLFSPAQFYTPDQFYTLNSP